MEDLIAGGVALCLLAVVFGVRALARKLWPQDRMRF